MTRPFLVRAPGVAPVERSAGAPLTLGGSQADGVVVPGLPAGALRLEPCAAGLVLVAATPGLRVASRPVAPGSRRLLRPGERAGYRAAVIELASAGSGVGGETTRVEAAAALRGALDGAVAPSGPHLVVLSGKDAGARVAIGRELLVGRGRGAGVRLDDPAVSRRHARLRAGPGGVTVEDVGARNRLRLNDVPVERSAVGLQPGDRITVGETELAFVDGPRRPARPARPAPPRATDLRPLLLAVSLALSAAALAWMG
jgi:hypothetical protein